MAPNSMSSNTRGMCWFILGGCVILGVSVYVFHMYYIIYLHFTKVDMPTMAPTRAPTPIPVITAPVVVHRTPTVYIHIGPHKTASSYIQNIIDAYKGPLSWQKYCWPGENGKSFHPFAMALQSNQNISSEFLDRFDACRRKQNKIIISTESFCIISPDAVGRLREMFANDTVRILVTYRNWLSRYYSIYTEIAKKNLHYLQPFSQFALRYEQEIAEKTGMDLVSMLRPWEEHFGRDALSIVDYDGVLAAGKDIGLVYLCEMLKLNCDKIRKDPTDFNQLVNKTPDMMAFDLLSLVRYLANFKYGCVPNPPKTDSYWEMSKLAQVIREKNLTVPTIPFRALSLRRLAVNFDNLVQEKYGDILLYANRTARMEAINNFHVEEIHLEAVMRSQALSQQLDNLVRELVKLGAFIECKMT